jgi:2-methylisocitrate lyase-like PEP mutase family enzyme
MQSTKRDRVTGNPRRGLAETFAALHAGPPILVLPNAWDAGSARVLVDAGFPAIATTSSGIAYSLRRPDGEQIERSEMLDAVARIAHAVAVPVSADLEAGAVGRRGPSGQTWRTARATHVSPCFP